MIYKLFNQLYIMDICDVLIEIVIAYIQIYKEQFY